MQIRVILTGRSYHNAAALPDVLELAEDAQVSDALAAINQQLPGEAPLAASCLIALAGQHIGSVANFTDRPMLDGQELTLVAPVAGG